MDSEYIDNLDFPDGYFEELRKHRVNSPSYCIIKGGLYEKLRKEAPSEYETAVNVSRALNRGEIDEAEELTGEVLEE